jgi:hypothetical protein
MVDVVLRLLEKGKGMLNMPGPLIECGLTSKKDICWVNYGGVPSAF